MKSDKIISRTLQTDLMYNAANMLQAVACMDEEAMEEISEIVDKIEMLANQMEARIGTPRPVNNEKEPILKTRP